jgi:ornithine cyclodeaminase
MSLPYLSATELDAALSPREAVTAVQNALRAGLDPAADPARVSVPVRAGELLLMPAEAAGAAGVKIVSVAPGNPGCGRPRIQGVYVLFDGESLAPVAVLDGAGLTQIRTAAVSLAAVESTLLSTDAPLTAVIFGAGPQGLAHAATARAVLAGRRDLRRLSYVVRDPGAVDLARLTGDAVIAQGSDAAAAAIAAAGLVVCATTARTPLFDADLVGDGAVVVAVGSHEPDARELDGRLLQRARVVVEDRGTALREAGDVILAISDSRLRPADLVPLTDHIRRPDLRPDRPLVFKSTGMPWEDLVVAQAIWAHVVGQRREGSDRT